MDMQNATWHDREGQATKQKYPYNSDIVGCQAGLCRYKFIKMYWNKSEWHEREGQVVKKMLNSFKMGAQKGLSKWITPTSPKLFSHLNVTSSKAGHCSKEDEEKTELPTPDITKKDITKDQPELEKEELVCSDNEVSKETGKNRAFRQKIFPLLGLGRCLQNVAMYLQAREICFVPRKRYLKSKLPIKRNLKGFEATIYHAMFTDEEMHKPINLFCEPSCKSCHDADGTDVDQTETKLTATLMDKLINVNGKLDEDTTVSEKTSVENDIRDVDNSDTESQNHSEDSCVLSTSEEKSQQNLEITDGKLCDCSEVDNFNSCPEASEIILENAHLQLGVKLRANAVIIQASPNSGPNTVAYGLNSSQDLKDKEVADENDHVKILSRTQMLMPRESEVTVFTVIGIIDRLAMGQQVPARESMKYEMLRFCTFRQYPTSGKPSTIKLAKAGFYYATNRDEVICYCCAKRISNWKENDDPMLAHKHVTPNCDFLLKNAEVNIPISITDESDVIQRLQRLENDPEFNNQVFHETSPEALERINNLLTDYVRSDGRPENDRSNIAVTSDPLEANRDSAVARDGIPAGSFVSSLPPTVAENRKEAERPFTSLVGRDVNNAAGGSTFQKLENMTGIMVSDFGRMPVFINTKAEQPSDDYSGNTDSSRGSSINTTARDNTNVTTNITTCSQSQRPPQIPSTITNTQPPITSQLPPAVTATKDTAVNSPSALPKYPRYSTRSARVASFSECGQIAVQIDWLCDAGFFYAGSGDSTRCFFCGIGLRHWSADDDPWTEHARFSIKCQFVLERKGQEFINIVKLAVEVSEKAAKNAAVSNTDVMKSEAAVSALAMGYSAEQVRKAIDAINAGKQSSTATNGGHQLNGHDILEEIFRMEEENNNASAITETPQTEPDDLTEEGACAGIVSRQSRSDILPLGSDRLPQQQRSASDSVVAKSDVERKKKRLLQENKMLRSASLCTKCNRREICMVFLPCGHLVTCEECGKATRICTSCASRVKGTVRTYMA